MSATAPVTTTEKVELPAGRVGNTYGPYGFRLGTYASDGVTFVADVVTGATVRCQARTGANAEIPGSAVAANLITVLTPDAQGWWYFDTHDFAAPAFRSGTYYWDLVVTYANGRVQTPMAGTIPVTAAVTA